MLGGGWGLNTMIKCKVLRILSGSEMTFYYSFEYLIPAQANSRLVLRICLPSY